MTTNSLLSQIEDLDLDNAQMQKIIENMIRLYVSKVQNDDEYEVKHKISPLPSKLQVTQTETAIFIDQLLKQMEIEVFELQMWRSMR
jgi:hypothetical protein